MMNKKNSIVFLLILLLASTWLVLAHNPRVETEDWGNFDNPYVIEDGAVSFAFFGSLDAGDDLDVFRLEFADDDDMLRLELLIPVCEDEYTNYYPEVLLLGIASTNDGLTEQHIEDILTGASDGTFFLESTPDPNFSLPMGTLPDGLIFMERYITRGEDETMRPIFYEHHTNRDYYEVETVDIPLEQAGTIYLIVYDSALEDSQAAGGDYLLATGYLEEFFRPLASEPEDVAMNPRGYWPHEGCDS